MSRPPTLQEAIALIFTLALTPLSISIFHGAYHDLHEGEDRAAERLTQLKTDQTKAVNELETRYQGELKTLRDKQTQARSALGTLQSAIQEDERSLREAERHKHDRERELIATRQEAIAAGLRVGPDGQVILPEAPKAFWEHAMETIFSEWERARSLAERARRLDQQLGDADAKAKALDSKLGRARLKVYDANRLLGQLAQDEVQREAALVKARGQIEQRFGPDIERAEILATSWGGVLLNDAWGVTFFILHLMTGLFSALLAGATLLRLLHFRGLWGRVRIS